MLMSWPGWLSRVSSAVWQAGGSLEKSPQAATTAFYQCIVHHFSGRIEVTLDGGTTGQNAAAIITQDWLPLLALTSLIFLII